MTIEVISHNNSSFEKQLSSDELTVLSFIYLVAGVLSFLGSSSIILISIKYGIVKQRTVLPLFHLSVADLIGALGIIIGAISNNVLTRPTDSISNAQRNYCIILTMVTTASFMATFFLTINYALQTYMVLSERLQVMNSTIITRMLRCCNWALYFPIFSWVFPFGLSLFISLIDSRRSKDGKSFMLDDDICTWCFPLFFYENGATCPSSKENMKETFNYYKFYKLFFLLIVGATIIVVMVILYLVLKRFKTLTLSGGMVGRAQYQSIQKVQNRTMVMIGGLLLCWFFPLILGLISLSSTFKMKKYFAFYVIESLTSPLQGFLNSIIYGWYSVTFRVTVHNNTDDERRPLLDPTVHWNIEREESDD